MNKPDSIIFDMDGTLWDALDIYVEAWNCGFRQLNLKRNVSRDEIAAMAGWEKQKVLEALMPGRESVHHEEIYRIVNGRSPELIKEIRGIVYDGVEDGLTQLAEKYKLFIVSNCAEGIIELFMDRAGINEYITDTMAHGSNLMPKHYNIKLLMDKYDLHNTVYVGDTEGDSEQSAIAKIPFVFLSSGFGSTEKYALKFENFKDFASYFINLK